MSVYSLTPLDFACLTNTCVFSWKDSFDEERFSSLNEKETDLSLIDEERFLSINDTNTDLSLKYAYWLGKSFANVLFAKMFLTSIGEPFQVLSDNYDGEWVIITNYETNPLGKHEMK